MTASAVAPHLFRQCDGEPSIGLAYDSRVEVAAAGSQHRAVGSEPLALHHDSDVTQHILLPLVIEAEQDVGAVHGRLIGKYCALTHRHPGWQTGSGRAVESMLLTVTDLQTHREDVT